MLGRIDDFSVLRKLDIRCGNRALLVHGQEQHLRFPVLGLEENLLQVQDDVGDVFHNAVDGGELVHGSIDLDGGNGRAFQRGEEHAPEGVANSMTITGFKRLGDELGVGWGCG
ncbi:hypothetical protein SDC9_187728 [bioreactor metagenome]|uniref:Uncharacterized protein n=1 Tax=bioreactor metagenome TaxID=1076179 RepID=A0A645HP08_9ZZZZ